VGSEAESAPPGNERKLEIIVVSFNRDMHRHVGTEERPLKRDTGRASLGIEDPTNAGQIGELVDPLGAPLLGRHHNEPLPPCLFTTDAGRQILSFGKKDDRRIESPRTDPFEKLAAPTGAEPKSDVRKRASNLIDGLGESHLGERVGHADPKLAEGPSLPHRRDAELLNGMEHAATLFENGSTGLGEYEKGRRRLSKSGAPNAVSSRCKRRTLHFYGVILINDYYSFAT
jgi:hypothetical protein